MPELKVWAVRLMSKFTLISPFLAFFVVMMITPFAACAPYIAAEEASLRTWMDSMSADATIDPTLSRVGIPSIT